MSTIKKADLTTSFGQKLLLTWVQSPLVVGVFIAPPCGTCSLARKIQLRDHKGRRIRGPRPLRDNLFPDGLPYLGPNDRKRVSLANKLYAFVQRILEVASLRNLIIVVENPRSSLFWATRFWRLKKIKLMHTARQACACGSKRPKWTVLARNRPAFRTINRSCPASQRPMFMSLGG